MSPTAEENARRFNYSDRESALAETLEIAQERIMELVGEMESNKEAHTIVLETKESVLRSLARQNTHLAMEVRMSIFCYKYTVIIYNTCLSLARTPLPLTLFAARYFEPEGRGVDCEDGTAVHIASQRTASTGSSPATGVGATHDWAGRLAVLPHRRQRLTAAFRQ